ncbi:neutral zinc metallopeptidase [Auraticoccus monumenti]|uniref:Neutral zinc metallopeptidase n=1 Tax=Auraticoccus monumenti TaxID=675864 RepID=A0A1G6ZLT9_9ACTN|nr:neutral zinc metallopeptidase [Auraticoccus monumenti]SDE02546.1 hypothetical protein SAMN04489747_2309 [Auraticoccus monumenti]
MTQQPWGPPAGQRPPAPQRNVPHSSPWNAAGPQQAPPGWNAPGQWPAQPSWGQQPQWGQQPLIRGPGGFAPPPRRRRNPLRTVFLAMCALAVVALGALVLVNLSGVGGSREVAYENEDYEVPPESATPPALPDYPTTFDDAYVALEENPLYVQTMPEPVRCELPAGNPWEMGDDELDAYITEEMACLTRVWQPALNAAGWAEVRPQVTVYSDSVTSGCGSMQGEEAVNAFYCPADQSVYFSTLMFEYLPDLRQPNIAALVMAHEYGHNVQARSNLLIPGQLLVANTDDEGTQLELSRRLEVQADCFAGSFFTSTRTSLGLTEEDFAGMEQALFNIGDDQLTGDPDVVGNHGHGDNRQLWGARGWTSTALSVCNSFIAPSSEVE